jgi:hypothetical protein
LRAWTSCAGPTARAVYLRRFLYEPPNATEIATYSEVLGLLSRKAREGSVAAAVALLRALRAQPNVEDEIDDALDRILDG